MLTAILKGVSKILEDGLTRGGAPVETKPGEKKRRSNDDVPRAYVESAKAMIDNIVAEQEKKPARPATIDEDPPIEEEPGLDEGGSAAKKELMDGVDE